MQKADNHVQTGVSGLDEVLKGGLTQGAIHLVEGESGSGKTLLGMHFSLEGLRLGETVLYMALSETRNDLEMVARSHGWDIGRLNIIEAASAQEQPSSMFHPAEVELGQAVENLKAAVDRVNPDRLVVDSLSEFRILGQSSPRYRRELLALKRYLVARGCTVLLLDIDPGDDDSQRSLVDGVILLESSAPVYGSDRRKLRILKLRGRSYAGGYHDFIIKRGGLQVFPRMIAAEHRPGHEVEVLHSGLQELDRLLGGGIQTGSSTLLIGPAGTGKSSIASLFVTAAIQRGEKALFFAFDELPDHILLRAKGLGLDLQSGLDNGSLHLQQVDPAELSPGHFTHIIRQEVEKNQVSVVVIDSLNGYLHAMYDERFLVPQLHELLSYLGQQGISTFLIVGQKGIGEDWKTPVDTSYLTDNALLFRFFEATGEIRRALSVIKMRSRLHERTIHELHFKPGGISIGQPLREFQGVLSTRPIYPLISDQLIKAANGNEI